MAQRDHRGVRRPRDGWSELSRCRWRCRGATAVGVGKAYLYGLAAGGVRGVERAFDFLTRETKRAMALIGVKNVDELRARGDDVVRERRR